jgi:hypothetical protein
VLASLREIAVRETARDPSTVFFVGTYTIGKERYVVVQAS